MEYVILLPLFHELQDPLILDCWYTTDAASQKCQYDQIISHLKQAVTFSLRLITQYSL